MPIRTTDFPRMLELGLGRAVQYARQNDVSAYRDVILNACLHNLTRDPQLEGSRADYMIDIIKATADFNFYRDRILEALVSVSDDSDDRDVNQHYDLALQFAQEGDMQARRAIYAAFDANPAFDDFIGARMIVWLDEMAGFEYIADKLGALLIAHGNEFPVGDYHYAIEYNNWLRSNLEDEFGADVLRETFERLKGNPNIAAFSAALYEKKEDEAPDDRSWDIRGVPYNDVRELIETRYVPTYDRTRRSGVRLTYWGKQATQAELAEAACDLLLQTDVERQVLYLSIFGKVTFPGDPVQLFPFTQSADELLAASAFLALDQINHPTVRQFALNLIATNTRLDQVPGLLVRNFEPGDWALIENITMQSMDKEAYHWMAFDVIKIFDEHPSLDAVGALLNLYENGLSGTRREDIIRALLSLDRLPDWMREECRYDANESLREAIRRNFEREIPSPED